MYQIKTQAEEFNIQIKKPNLDFEKKQARNMKKHADKNKLCGDVLKNKALEDDDEEKQKQLLNGASSEYIKASEKYMKTILVAAGGEKEEYYDPKNRKRKVLKDHSKKVLFNALTNKGIESISYEEAKVLDEAHSGEELTYIALEYGKGSNGEEIEMDISKHDQIQDITNKISEKCNQLIKEAKQQKIKETEQQKIQQIVDEALKLIQTDC